jgi:hypothetical protein
MSVCDVLPGYRVSWVCLTTSVLLCFPSLGRTEFLPLEEGYSWVYEGIAGLGETQTVVGRSMLFGESVFVIRVHDSDSNEGLENYWTVSPEGHVLLWGYFRVKEDFGRLYFPPVRLLDYPPSLGKTWTTTFRVYELPDTLYTGISELVYLVYDEGVIDVPAGSFFSYGIGTVHGDMKGLSPANYDLFGRTSEGVGERRLADKWWCYGIGLTQYLANDLYQLVEFTGPTAIQESSIGRIKALFSTERGE